MAKASPESSSMLGTIVAGRARLQLFLAMATDRK
jgi:hypothetical protein